MKKIQTFFISLLLLLVCITPVTALADSQSTIVRYSVPATVIYRDYDGTSTTQKVDVGAILKAPEPKGKPGCLFEGWRNEATGLLWDFASPVTEHMVLTASYSEFQEDADGSIPIGKGRFSIVIKVENHVTDASIGTSGKELLNMLLQDGSITSDEIAQIADGASMEVVLVIKDGANTISEASKAQMQQTADGYTIGQYLDISLMKYLTVNGQTGEGQLISRTSGMITVSVRIPDEMVNTDENVERTYIVIRNHEGKAEILDSEYNADTQMITFRTNLFSDYAIAYKDVKKPGQSDGTGDNGTQKNHTSGTTAKTPKTGDIFDLNGYGMVLVVSVVIILLCMRRRKKQI